MNKKYKILSYVILILTTLILITLIFNNPYVSGNITGSVIEGIHKNGFIYTKAICNSTNYCEDYEIKCSGDELIRLNPTGFAVQFPDDWKDPRNKEEIDGFC